MSLTKEQIDIFYQVYNDPVKFIEMLVCPLTPAERELLDSFVADGNPRHLFHNRDVANKTTFLFAIWASIFQIDTTTVIAVPSISSRVALETEALHILSNLPHWLIEEVEVTGDFDCMRFRINDSCDLIICAAQPYMLRGRTIKNCIVQDLIEVKDPDDRDDLLQFGSVFCPIGHGVIALYTNMSTMSIS